MKGRAVVFDMFGVLCSPTSPENEIIEEYRLDPNIYDRLQRAVCGYRFTGDWDAYVHQIIEAAGIEDNHTNDAAIRRILGEEFEKGYGTVRAEAKDVLAGLKGEGYRLGLLSNAYPPCRRIIEDRRLIDYFERGAAIFSYEVGMTKQDPGIFRLCLRRLGAKAPNAVMVGDSLKSDILGASEATNGEMGGILLSENPSPEAVKSGCAIVSSLAEVPVAVRRYFEVHDAAQ